MVPVQDGARKKDGSSSSDNKEKFHALVAGSSNSCTFIIYSGEYRHMASTTELLSSIHSNSVLDIQMGDDSEIQTEGVGTIDLEHGYLIDVLYVPYLVENLLSLYQMRNIG